MDRSRTAACLMPHTRSGVCICHAPVRVSSAQHCKVLPTVAKVSFRLPYMISESLLIKPEFYVTFYSKITHIIIYMQSHIQFSHIQSHIVIIHIHDLQSHISTYNYNSHTKIIIIYNYIMFMYYAYQVQLFT
jgi:hypothetical protein